MRISGANVTAALSLLLSGQDPNGNSEEQELARTFHSILLDVQLNKYLQTDVSEELETIESEEEEAFTITYDELYPEHDTFSFEFMKTVLTWKEANNASFAVVNRRWPSVKAPVYLTRFANYIERNGTRHEKLKKITMITWDKFKQARTIGIQVHDVQIRQWAISEARSLGLNDFRASDTWILKFKSNHRISSRRVTKFVTRANMRNADQIEMAATSTIVELQDFMESNNVSPDDVYNTDQSGINYELHTARTLSYTGERNTQALIASANARTHSYTIMPFISMSGRMCPKALICLKEITGAFGPIVLEQMFKPDNLHITCSKSGKMSTALMKEFIAQVYLPNVADRTILLLDSWTGQQNNDIYAVNDKTIKRFKIPEGATGFMQPLDVFRFRQWKGFIKKFQEKILLDGSPLVLHERNNIIKLNSLILNQFQSEYFKETWKYAWSKSGFDVPTGGHHNVNDHIFDFTNYICEKCNIRTTFIRCSWVGCRKHFCTFCFFMEYHKHELDSTSSTGSSPMAPFE